MSLTDGDTIVIIHVMDGYYHATNQIQDLFFGGTREAANASGSNNGNHKNINLLTAALALST